MSGIDHHEKRSELSDLDIEKLIQLNLEMITNSFLKISSVDFKKDPEYKNSLSEFLKNWASATIEVYVFKPRNGWIELIEQLHTIERMNIIMLELLNNTNSLNTLVHHVNDIMQHKSKNSKENDTANVVTIISASAMIAQKIEDDLALQNDDFAMLHTLLLDEAKGAEISKGFETPIKSEDFQKHKQALNEIEVEISKILKGNFLITKDLSEYLQGNKTLVDPALQEKYLATFRAAITDYDTASQSPPLSPVSDLSSRASASDVSETASDTDESDSENTSVKKPRPGR